MPPTMNAVRRRRRRCSGWQRLSRNIKAATAMLVAVCVKKSMPTARVPHAAKDATNRMNRMAATGHGGCAQKINFLGVVTTSHNESQVQVESGVVADGETGRAAAAA